MTLHVSSYTLPPQGSFCLTVQCIKVCMTAQSYCPLASGMSSQQSHHSQCYKWASARMPLCRTALGEVWPCCARRHTPWSVTHRKWKLRLDSDRHSEVHLLYVVCILSSHLDSQFERDVPDNAERRIESSLCQVLLCHQVSKSLLNSQHIAHVTIEKN